MSGYRLRCLQREVQGGQHPHSSSTAPAPVATSATSPGSVAKVAMSQRVAQQCKGHGRHRTTHASRAAAAFNDLRRALQVGSLALCCNCKHFRFGADLAAFGHCTWFIVDAAPFVPFMCPGFAVSSVPVAPAFLPAGPR